MLFKNDPISPVVKEASVEEAVRYCQEGLSHSGALRSEPFFNPHLLVSGSDRIDDRRRFYEQLFNICKPYFINVGVASKDEIQKRINEVIGI